MPRALRLLSFVVVAFVLAAQSTAGDRYTARERDEHTRWIESVLHAVSKLRPGMPRKALSDMFTEEGGLSTRTQRTYVFTQCPYIKIDVKFTPIPNGSPVSAERPEDKIVSVSAPYLDYRHFD